MSYSELALTTRDRQIVRCRLSMLIIVHCLNGNEDIRHFFVSCLGYLYRSELMQLVICDFR